MDLFALEFASECMCAEKEVVMTAVHRHGEALEFAFDELRMDKDKHCYGGGTSKKVMHALRYASKDLRADKDKNIVMAAVHQKRSCMHCVTRPKTCPRKMS